ncbi:MAG: carbon monoxide dehydrogenase subunit G [Acetobacteraceae bacterium]|nr:carbon monoxide dehydrogenase subunit G [Acetobacteraceae bacterium]
MDMSGERRIPAPRDRVWAALNDPEVLKESIPGCQSLEKVSDTDLRATASIKIGPISARFTGKVELKDLDPPNAYRIEGEGQGGVAGFAKGGAAVKLADIEEGTLLTYDVKAQVGGKIAQLGARLIDATAKSYADNFFTRFAAQVAQPVSVASVADAAVPAGDETATPPHADATPAVTAPTYTPAVRPLPTRESAMDVFSRIPSAPLGFPIIAWIGGVIFLFIFVMIFGTYL